MLTYEEFLQRDDTLTCYHQGGLTSPTASAASFSLKRLVFWLESLGIPAATACGFATTFVAVNVQHCAGGRD
jgi:hypothetical protein